MSSDANPPAQPARAGPAGSRLDRRKAKTRAALVSAAQQLLAGGGGTELTIQEITDKADVGFGSFYNHFESKTELLQAAIDDTLEAHGAWLDAVAAELDDPAETFCAAFRVTGRLIRSQPLFVRVVLHTGLTVLGSDRGLAPRARRDIAAAAARGRFDVSDPDAALAMAGGALLGLLNLLDRRPDLDASTVTDDVTRRLLLAFGLPLADASELVSRPLLGVD